MEDRVSERAAAGSLSERLQFVIGRGSSITQIKAGSLNSTRHKTHSHMKVKSKRWSSKRFYFQISTHNHTDVHLESHDAHSHKASVCDLYCTDNFTHSLCLTHEHRNTQSCDGTGKQATNNTHLCVYTTQTSRLFHANNFPLCLSQFCGNKKKSLFSG